MSPSWVTPEAAVDAVEDLLALLMSGHTIELVPLDLIGDDRVALRLTGLHGEPVEPTEVRIGSMRKLAAGIRQLRELALGEAEERSPAPAYPEAAQAEAGGLPLGLMAAMMGGLGDRSGDAAMWPGGEIPGGPAGKTNPGAMAEAIAAAVRPARFTQGPSQSAAADEHSQSNEENAHSSDTDR